MPIASIRQVVVFGNVQVSTQALHTLAEAEVPIAFLSGIWQVHRRGRARAAEERGAAGRPVPGVLRPGAVVDAGQGGRRAPRSPTSGRS